MTTNLALLPDEAAHIAANAYFSLEGWDKTYQYKLRHGASAKGAPKPRAGLEDIDITRRNVTGTGPLSLANTGINNGNLVSSFTGSSGTNLFGRTVSGYGYLLKFERGGRNHLVFAIRGTRPEMGYPDLLTDANIGLCRTLPGVGPVHAGFYDVYQSLLSTITAAQGELDSADVIHCVGHSLGGAVANLVALHLAKTHKKKLKLYTFGAPRVGLRLQQYDKVVRNMLGEENIYRVSHNFDLIPMIPVAPFIHVHPHVNDRNNFFLKSPVNKIGLDNHDTGEYIRSVGNLSWEKLRAAKLEEGYLDKQYFNSWRTSDSWFKRQLGNSMNVSMTIMQRILQGLIDSIGVGLTGVATVLDLLAISIRKGVDTFQVGTSYIRKFLKDCIAIFNIGVKVTREVLIKLYKKLTTEMTIIAKQSLAQVKKIAKSAEFKIFLKTAATGSIGLMLM